MFISYYYTKYLEYKDDGETFSYELTDSEFGRVLGIATATVMGSTIVVEIGSAVIQEYSKRNLNVAANLAVALVWWQKQHPFFTIQHIIDSNIKYIPSFSQYEIDLQKYMVLL
jgi:hypothetical protein